MKHICGDEAVHLTMPIVMVTSMNKRQRKKKFIKICVQYKGPVGRRYILLNLYNFYFYSTNQQPNHKRRVKKKIVVSSFVSAHCCFTVQIVRAPFMSLQTHS